MNNLIETYNLITKIGEITGELEIQSSKKKSFLFIRGVTFFNLFILIPFLIAHLITNSLDLIIIVIIVLFISFFINRALICIKIIRGDLEEKTNKLIYEKLKESRKNFEKKYGFYISEVSTELWVFGMRNIFNSIYVIFFNSILNILPIAYLIQNYNSLLVLSTDLSITCIQVILTYLITLSFLNHISLMLIYGQRNEKFNYYKITYKNKKTIIGKIIKRDEEEITLSKSGETIKIKTSDILKEKLIA